MWHWRAQLDYPSVFRVFTSIWSSGAFLVDFSCWIFIRVRSEDILTKVWRLCSNKIVPFGICIRTWIFLGSLLSILTMELLKFFSFRILDIVLFDGILFFLIMNVGLRWTVSLSFSHQSLHRMRTLRCKEHVPIWDYRGFLVHPPKVFGICSVKKSSW